MKFRMKAAVAGLVTAGLFAGMVGAAFAATPPWEPDTNARGAVLFFDAAGNQINGGSTSSSPAIAYARTSAAPRAGDNTATLYGALAQPGVNPALWPNTQMSAGNTFPVAGAPNGLAASGFGLYKGAAGEATIASLPPHPASDTGTAYQGMYEIRIYTSAPGTGLDTLYWETDIQVTGSTWQVVYPAAVNSTSTSLTVSPASPQTQGATLSLTATVTPAPVAGATVTGTVQFVADGTTNLGSPVTVVNGVASTTNNTLSAGNHQLTAVFTPTPPPSGTNQVAYTSSTSPASAYTINAAPAANTSTGLAVNTGAGQAQSPVTFTATVSPTVAPGTVTFSETPTGTFIGTTPAGNGTFVLTSNTLSAGPHSVIATFNPSNTANYNSSVSPPVNFTLAPSNFVAVSTDVQNVTATVPAGALVISTPYNSTNPLSLGLMALNSSGTQFSATATFQNIALSDTRAGAQPITAKAQSSNMTSGTNVINSQNLGLTSLVPTFTPGNGIQAGQVTTYDNPAANPAVAPAAAGTAGLGGGVAHTIATVTNGPGAFSMNGTLTLNAPSSTPAGTYAGTITFTAG